MGLFLDMLLLIAAHPLIALHAPTGKVVLINPAQIVHLQMARPAGDPKKLVTPGAMCVVTFSSGSFLSVTEPCGEVRQLIESNRQ